jgi:dihydrofolate reductase
MRKIIEYCLVSADGIVLDDPFPFRDYDDDAYLRDRLGTFAACDAILWGRTTYERFAKRSPRSEGIPPYAPRLNAIRKYVFSSKLETAEWNNSTVVRGDVAAEVTKLKQQDGGDLLILGHGLLGISGELGALATNTTYNITNNQLVLTQTPAFLKLQASLLHALAPFPEARAAAVAALRDLDNENAPPAVPTVPALPKPMVIEHDPA